MKKSKRSKKVVLGQPLTSLRVQPPERGNRHREKAVSKWNGIPAKIKDNPTREIRSGHLLQELQMRKISRLDAMAGFDFHRRKFAVAPLDHKINLFAVRGAKVAEM